MKRIVIVLGILLTILPLSATAVVEAESPSMTEDIGFSQLRSNFLHWTQLDSTLNGYVKESVCYDDASLGGEGFHAKKATLIDSAIVTSQPESVVLNSSGNVVAVEYISTAETQPSFTSLVTGQTVLFNKIPAASSGGAAHWSLHVWFIPNTNGTFAQYNPSVTCPAGTTPPPTPTPTPEPATPASGDITLPWTYLAIMGGILFVIGLGILRRTAHKS